MGQCVMPPTDGVLTLDSPPAKKPRAVMTAPATTPFFVVGSQWSGTTMLRLMLNKHPDLCVPHESGFIVELARRAGEFGEPER